MTNTSTALMVPASGVNKGDYVCFVVCLGMAIWGDELSSVLNVLVP